MRFFLSVLLILLFSTSLEAFEIVRVLPAYKTERDFERISEYFTGKENPGKDIMLRSREGSREGYYLTVRVKTPHALQELRVELQMIQADDGRDIRKYSFITDLPKGSHLLNIGVTGEDWKVSSRQPPVAWKLVFKDAWGWELASRQSYLWSKPAGKP